MGIARELTCDRLASYPGGVQYSHPLALRKPGISTSRMSIKARQGLNCFCCERVPYIKES